MRFARWWTWAAAASLAGCAATETVHVPVPVPCIDKVPARPEACVQRDASRPEWLRCALVERERLLGYVGELEAVLGACVAP